MYDMFVGGLLFMSHGGHASWGSGYPFVVCARANGNCFLKEICPCPWVRLPLPLYRGRSMQAPDLVRNLRLHKWMPSS